MYDVVFYAIILPLLYIPFHELVCIGNLTHLRQLTRLIELQHDVGASNELAIDVELRDGWPRAVNLDALTNARVRQHIHSLVGYIQSIQDPTRGI